jgi:hypothetical protein
MRWLPPMIWAFRTNPKRTMTMSGATRRNPFVGPRPIQEGEVLHGRTAEVRGLYHQLQARRIVVLHAPSGAGKSSLVRAGLIPELKQAKYDVWKPIRVNLDPSGIADLPEGTNRYLLSAMVSLEEEIPAARRRPPRELAKLEFLDYLETRPRRKSMLDRSVVLLFDQFEEILTVDPRAIGAKQEFFDAVGRALNNEKYWALFIIREDYLAALSPYHERIPTHLSNTVRLDLLGLDGAREAALNLAKEGGRSFPAVDKLIRDLSMVQVQQPDGSFVAEQGPYVEPVHLQVVCRRLWDAMPADAESIDEEHVEAYAQVSKSLGAYYADAVRSIADGDAAVERSIRDWMSNKVIVGGIRSQVRQETGSSAGLDNQIIKRLLDCYLVRAEQRAGVNWFELSHDRLVEPVLTNNEEWEQANLHPLQVQAKIWEDQGRTRELLLGPEALPGALVWARDNPALLTDGERAFLGLSQTLRAEKLRQRRRQRVFTVVLLVAALAIAFGATAWRMRGTAVEKREVAEAARLAAEAAQRELERARNEAESARQLAIVARREAEQARQKNDRLTRDVLQQMFQVALGHFIESLAAEGSIAGEVQVDRRWTPLLERRGQRFAAANIVDGGGRLVVAGHDAVLRTVDEHGDSLFLEITTQWLLGDQARRGVVITSQRPEDDLRSQALERSLSALGYEAELALSLDDLETHEDAGVLIIDNRWSPQFTDAEIAAVAAFVERGGGVLAVGAGWSWQNRQPGEGELPAELDAYPMNEILADFGVRWGAATIKPEKLGSEAEKGRVRFENRRSEPVDVYSLNPSGSEEYYKTLATGEMLEILTALTSMWVIRSKGNNQKIQNGDVVIRYEDQIVTIGTTVTIKKVEHRSKPKKPKPAKLPTVLSDEAMQSAHDTALEAARTCAKIHHAVYSNVRIKFRVRPDGTVTGAQALAPLKGTPVGNCVAKALSKQRLPASVEGASETWNLPL